MEKAKVAFRERFALLQKWEPPLEPLVPETCSKSCQCKDYFPCNRPEHNPCAFKISFEANHTHIRVEIPLNGTIKLRKVCVSPKCLGNFDEAPLINDCCIPLRIPPIRCYACYYRTQQRLGTRLARADEPNTSSLVWAWRKNNPG